MPLDAPHSSSYTLMLSMPMLPNVSTKLSYMYLGIWVLRHFASSTALVSLLLSTFPITQSDLSRPVSRKHKLSASRSRPSSVR
ncbi:hypothetical protein P154DRAFT_526681 [Amniculicola lignicola CBS 123094]|uniref:Uncharacterized protein n=1 Tax=Amniculicola lignicola CBS 123094 TaxID=1392246 RepID=A0A6A5W1B3_9PLEO|nr:hypothetical protein P154DRAFT_526681 [Amniculicola lignicola CBS 123094]